MSSPWPTPSTASPTTARTGRAGSHQRAIEEVVRCRARQFTPDVVDTLCLLHRFGVLAETFRGVNQRAPDRDGCELTPSVGAAS